MSKNEKFYINSRKIVFFLGGGIFMLQITVHYRPKKLKYMADIVGARGGGHFLIFMFQIIVHYIGKKKKMADSLGAI